VFPIVAGSVKEGKTIHSDLVSLRKQKSPVLAVNHGRRKPVFRRVSAVSGDHSFCI
jgi:hypothetical protein